MHAINRGIMFEGLGCIVAGLWGSGNGANTFGENVGTLGNVNIYLIIYDDRKYIVQFSQE